MIHRKISVKFPEAVSHLFIHVLTVYPMILKHVITLQHINKKSKVEIKKKSSVSFQLINIDLISLMYSTQKYMKTAISYF